MCPRPLGHRINRWAACMASQVHINSLNLGLNFKPGFEKFKPRFKTQSAHLFLKPGFQLLKFSNPGLKFKPRFEELMCTWLAILLCLQAKLLIY